MTAGNQATTGSINNTLTQYSITLRDTCQNILNLQEFITTIGLPGLEALGYSSADASTVVTMTSYLNTIAQVFNGTAAQPSQFNFGNALSGLYAGG